MRFLRIPFSFVIAFLLLLFMGGLAFSTLGSTALTFDELAHIPSGYSYLTQRDYRLNPEHPPVAKDLAAFPLLFLDLRFPTESPWWQQEEDPAWWVQFNMGTEFLYESGNNPKDIIFWSRVPMVLLFLLTGFMLFLWIRRAAGDAAALGALFLFSFSPTLLAHGRLLTTDIAAALGAILVSFLWISFLKNPAISSALLAGLALGVALLLKFSMVLLIPYVAILTFAYLAFWKRGKDFFKYMALSAFAGIASLFLIWPVYQFHIFSYPAERQLRDTLSDLQPGEITRLEQAAIWMADKPGLRPLAQYARGALMANQRSSFGNTTYFLGEVFSGGRLSYFPVVYLTKIPLALHAMTGLILLFGVWLAVRKRRNSLPIDILAAFLFLGLYWAVTLKGNLNIGIRHLIPTFPFVYLLLAWGASKIHSSLRSLSSVFLFWIGVILLGGWYLLASLSSYPFYLSYYNELGGGIENGYKVAVDSNYDWGQDFYLLLAKVEEHNIETLRLHYFGGENPRYWLGDKYIEMNCSDQREEKQRTCQEAKNSPGWIAISLNELQGGSAQQAPGYEQPTDYYAWLKKEKPVDRAGTSILLYRLD